MINFAFESLHFAVESWGADSWKQIVLKLMTVLAQHSWRLYHSSSSANISEVQWFAMLSTPNSAGVFI